MTILAEQPTTTNHLDSNSLPVDTSITDNFRPSTERTEAQRTWAASVLAELPTKFYFSDHEVKKVRDAQGNAWRKAFIIRAIPGKFFEIQFRRGASPADLKHAERLIRAAKHGYFNDDIWTPTTYEIAGPGYYCSALWAWDGKEDIDELRPCTMLGCKHQFHEYRSGDFNECHTAGERLDHASGLYWISLENYEDEQGWHPYLSMDSDWPTGPEGLKALRDAANDYAWMLAEADKLNAAEVDAR